MLSDFEHDSNIPQLRLMAAVNCGMPCLYHLFDPVTLPQGKMAFLAEYFEFLRKIANIADDLGQYLINERPHARSSQTEVASIRCAIDLFKHARNKFTMAKREDRTAH
ncbi:Uncharacterised protein [Achromobacter sp. 2789STDY5608615]|nr:Uncharacterised protein [Achromobacter sp. 2789STDY5608615]